MRRGIKRLSAMKRLSSAMLSSRRSVYIDSVFQQSSGEQKNVVAVGGIEEKGDDRRSNWK